VATAGTRRWSQFGTERLLGTERLAKVAMALFWTSGYIVGALATAHTPALTVSFWRLLVATPLMVMIALAAGARWPRGTQLGWVVLTGLLLQAVQFSGVYTALEVGVPAGLVALLAGTSPVLVALGGSPPSWPWSRRSALASRCRLPTRRWRQSSGSRSASRSSRSCSSSGCCAGKGGEATSFLYVVPSLTAIAAVPVLGQSLNPGVVIGLALGLVGVSLVGGGRRER
jgi:drug/metabolite transporter (DMT)-like permease